jgi:hypothetical protein
MWHTVEYDSRECCGGWQGHVGPHARRYVDLVRPTLVKEQCLQTKQIEHVVNVTQ